jgi:hypothetical protein
MSLALHQHPLIQDPTREKCSAEERQNADKSRVVGTPDKKWGSMSRHELLTTVKPLTLQVSAG